MQVIKVKPAAIYVFYFNSLHYNGADIVAGAISGTLDHH